MAVCRGRAGGQTCVGIHGELLHAASRRSATVLGVAAHGRVQLDVVGFPPRGRDNSVTRRESRTCSGILRSTDENNQPGVTAEIRHWPCRKLIAQQAAEEQSEQSIGRENRTFFAATEWQELEIQHQTIVSVSVLVQAVPRASVCVGGFLLSSAEPHKGTSIPPTGFTPALVGL